MKPYRHIVILTILALGLALARLPGQGLAQVGPQGGVPGSIPMPVPGKAPTPQPAQPSGIPGGPGQQGSQAAVPQGGQPAPAQGGQPAPAGTVEALEGQAEARLGQAQPRKLAKGAAVYAQDVVSTPTAKDKARIAFADGSSLELGPESTVTLKDFAFDEADKDKSRQAMAMGKGMFRFVTGKVVAQNPDNLKIESPLSVIGIRGTTTDHWVKVKPSGELEAELHALRETKSGSEVVVASEGQTLTLTKPGQVAWVRPNLPGSVRDLTDEEKQSFGKGPINRRNFDPPARASFVGGAN